MTTGELVVTGVFFLLLLAYLIVGFVDIMWHFEQQQRRRERHRALERDAEQCRQQIIERGRAAVQMIEQITDQPRRPGGGR